MPDQISETQDLLLRLVEKNRFNNFDGVRVAADLRSHRRLWRMVAMTQLIRPVFQPRQNPVTSPSYVEPPLYQKAPLRGYCYVVDDTFVADYLVLYAEPGAQGALEQLTAQWSADEAWWVGADEGFRTIGARSLEEKRDFEDDDRVILILWWD